MKGDLMNAQQLDLWNAWHRPMSLILQNGRPVTDGFIHICPQEPQPVADGQDHTHGCGCGHDHDHDCDCGGHDHDCDCGCVDDHNNSSLPDGCAIQTDVLVNMLYFAIFRAHCGVRLYGAEGDILEISADELKTLSAAVDQLSTVFGLKTGQLSLEQFAQEFANQTVYYSTLVGETDDGQPAFFACALGDDGIRYYPVFLTEEHLRAFMDAHHRSAYVILQNSLPHFLSLLDANENLKELGAVIEPLYSCSVGFPPGFRVG
jgi:hypothetical protein